MYSMNISMKRFWFIIHTAILISILWSTHAYAQSPTFDVIVNKKIIGMNERLKLQFKLVVPGGGRPKIEAYTAPSFPGFSSSGPTQSTSYSNINGKESNEYTFTYTLRPKKIGVIPIAPASVIVNEKSLQTESIEIEVKEKSPNQSASSAKDVFIRMLVSKSRPYVGEQILVTYELYFNKDLQGLQQIDAPQFSGFWSKQIKLSSNARIPVQAVYKNKAYSKVTLAKYVLIPQKYDKIKVDPFVADIKVMIATNRRGIFQQRIYSYEDVTVSSPIRTINVKPLPDKGRPTDFSGAVGNFKYKTRLSKKNAEINEPVSVSISISGKGNLGLFDLPTPVAPSQIESYEPKTNSKLRTTASGLSGSIQTDILFVPRTYGEYKINLAPFSYFDPSKKKYIKVPQDELAIKIEGENSNLNTASNGGSSYIGSVQKENVDYLSTDIRYIKEEKISPSVIPPLFKAKETFYHILWIIALVGTGIMSFTYYKKRSINTSSHDYRRKCAERVAMKYIIEAKKSVQKQDKEKIYEMLYKSLTSYITHRYPISQDDIREDKLQEILAPYLSDDFIKQLIDLWQTLAFVRFAPSGDGLEDEKIIERVKNLISSLQKQG